MIFRFNTGQLERGVHDALSEILNVLQSESESELVVSVIEYPKKFLVKGDGDIGMFIVWDDEKKAFAGVTEPKPESEKDTVDLPKPETELDKHIDVDPIRLAKMKYELMSTHLNMPFEKKVIFAIEYSRLWSEHR